MNLDTQIIRSIFGLNCFSAENFNIRFLSKNSKFETKLWKFWIVEEFWMEDKSVRYNFEKSGPHKQLNPIKLLFFLENRNHVTYTI